MPCFEGLENYARELRPLSTKSSSGQSKVLSLIFKVLAVAAILLVVQQMVLTLIDGRSEREVNVPQLRRDVVARLEMLGLERSPDPANEGGLLFYHPPAMTADDIMLALRRIMRDLNLNLGSAVNYEERRALYVELNAEEKLVAKITFSRRPINPLFGEGASPKIAIIIDDFGYQRNIFTAGYMTIGEKLTLAVIPGLRYSTLLHSEGVDAGHEVIIHMPMEPENYNGRNDEDYILLYGMNKEDAVSRIRSAFRALPRAVGMNNHEGSLGTRDTTLLAYLAEELKDRDKFFIDSYTTPKTQGDRIMRKFGVPTVGRDVFLDVRDDKDSIRRQLIILAARARSRGYAVGIGHVGAAHLNTLEVLREEMPKLKDQGFEFIFVSEIVRK